MLGLAYALGGDREIRTQDGEPNWKTLSPPNPYTILRGDKGVGLAKIYLGRSRTTPRRFPKRWNRVRTLVFGSFAKGVADMMVVGETEGAGLWVAGPAARIHPQQGAVRGRAYH